MNSSPNRFLFTIFSELPQYAHWPAPLPSAARSRRYARAMAENNHLLHAVRCSHTNTMLSAIGRRTPAQCTYPRFRPPWCRRYGYRRAARSSRCRLDLIGIKHENKMTPAHALIIAQHVDDFAGGVDITGGNTAQLVPREDDVVAVHEQIIVLTDAGDYSCSSVAAFTALLEGFKAAVLTGP